MNKISNLLWGLVFVVLGVIFGLNALEITDINVFFDGWWTLFIIVPCFIGLFKDEDKTGNYCIFKISGVINDEIIIKEKIKKIVEEKGFNKGFLFADDENLK